MRILARPSFNALRAMAALFAVALAAQLVAAPGEAASGRRRASVISVTDGDTIEVRRGEGTFAVRLLGVDTPETVHPTVPDECFGREASNFTHKKLEDRSIRLEFDKEREDQYGRTLAYVWLGKRLFNVVLVRRGFATALIYQPNDRYADRLLKAEDVARRNGRGLWDACRSEPEPGPEGDNAEKCDSAYPTVCIAPPPPDLDCPEVPYQDFKVRAPDPHGFDGNDDGIGCET